MPYLLTFSMVHRPSWAANWFAASQEIPRISRNPKVHYRTHKLPPPVSIPGQPNPVHIPTSHLLEIHPNITHPSTHRSPQWSLSLRFSHQEAIHPFSSPIRATCPTHHILLDFISRTILGEQYRSFSSSLCSLHLYLHLYQFQFRKYIAHETAVCRNSHSLSKWDSYVTRQFVHKQTCCQNVEFTNKLGVSLK